MALKFAITDLAGVQRAVITQYADALVTIPYNNSRTAELTLSALDPAAAQSYPLSRLLKAWYVWPDGTTELVFWGPIITPTWSLTVGSSQTLKIEAHDMSIRLKNHYLIGTDSFFSGGADPGSLAISYTGLRALRDAGKNTGAENSAGIPDLGIANGTNSHSPGARTIAVQKGDEVWERFTDIASDVDGPDFRLRPDDTTPGVYALLDTFDKAETEGGVRDRREEVLFHAGFGTDTVESFTYAPQGGSVKNDAIVQQAHSDETPDTVAEETNLVSQQAFGNYVYWEAAGEFDSNSGDALLDAKANAILLAYAQPPRNFSLIARNDETQRFIYGRDYGEGEVISCAAHFGQLRVWLAGLVNEVRLRQKSETGLTQAELDVLPESDVEI